MKRREQIENEASTYAIDEVKETCNPASKRGLLYTGFIDGAVWSDEHPNWISVEDELPKPNEFVLVYGKSDGYDFIEIDRMMINNNEWAYMDDVSHWMPLPQPPKGGEK